MKPKLPITPFSVKLDNEYGYWARIYYFRIADNTSASRSMSALLPIASIFIGGRVGGLDPPYNYCSTSARSRFRLGRAYCSNGIDAHRAARRKVTCKNRHRPKQHHNHDDRQRIVGSHPVEKRGNEVREAERERQP